DVEHDQIRVLRLRERDGGAPVTRGRHGVAVLLEVVAQRVHDRRLVVDEQDPLLRREGRGHARAPSTASRTTRTPNVRSKRSAFAIAPSSSAATSPSACAVRTRRLPSSRTFTSLTSPRCLTSRPSAIRRNEARTSTRRRSAGASATYSGCDGFGAARR